MRLRIEQRDGRDWVVNPFTGARTLLTEPLFKLVGEGFEPARAGCLHWLVDGHLRQCYRDNHNRRAEYPCRLPISHDWDHVSSWQHPDRRRTLHFEPYGMRAASSDLLTRFASRYALDLEFDVEACQRNTSPAVSFNLTSQGEQRKRPRRSREQLIALNESGLWEWEFFNE